MQTAVYQTTYTVTDNCVKYPKQIKKVTAPRLEDIEPTIRRNLLRSGNYSKWMQVSIHHKAFLGFKN